MNDSTTWQDFCMLYYDQAISIAGYHLNNIKGSSPRWDENVDEEAVCVDAVMEALQKAFVKYDPSRGASLKTYISRLVHNELVDELKRETKSLVTLNDVTAKQEADISIRDMVSHIPEEAMENLKEKLRKAILKLPPIEQSILGFFLQDPKTFVERSVSALHITPNYVRVHKCRAIAKLPLLMNVSQEEYFEMYEDHQFAGSMHMIVLRPRSYINPVCPQFDLDDTVLRLMEAVNSAIQTM